MKKWLTIIIVVSLCSCAKIFGQPPFPAPPNFRFEQGFNFNYIVLFTDNFEERRLRVFASVIYDNLQFFKVEDKFQASYRMSFTIFDKKENFVKTDRIERSVVLSDFEETNSREKYDWVEANFDLNPGQYRIFLEMFDQGSHETLNNEQKLYIPGLDTTKLLLSGPILLDTIVVDTDGMLELKPGISGDIFDGQKSVWVYFEVLAHNYPTTLEFTYHLLDSKGKERVKGDFARSLDKPTFRYQFPLDVDEFPFDNYTLTLTVKSNGELARSSKKFRIHWPELPATIQDLDLALEQLIYIASEKEIARLKENYMGQKVEMFLKFWEQWGSSQQEAYKLMNEYYNRVWEAEHLFSEGGWKCDRGHVYILFGPPSEIDRHPYDIGSKAYEVWYYFTDNRRFMFVDEGGFGDYRLQSPLWQN
jgi:GWxTD domain-containing protein